MSSLPASLLKVVIADDHPLMLMGVADLLARDIGIDVRATATSPSELVAVLQKELPDVLVTDYSMPDDPRYGDGMAFIGYLLRQFPGLKILVLTMLSNPMIVASLYDLGVAGVVQKQHDHKELIRALRSVALGNRYHPPGTLPTRRGNTGACASGTTPVSLDARVASLSPREFEVLRLFAQGLAVGEVAEKLNRSIKTVSSQKTAAIKKLGVANNQELIAFCTQNRLFSG